MHDRPRLGIRGECDIVLSDGRNEHSLWALAASFMMDLTMTGQGPKCTARDVTLKRFQRVGSVRWMRSQVRG